MRLRLDRDEKDRNPPPPPQNYGAAPSGFGQPPPPQQGGFSSYQAPPPREDYHRGPPPPRFEDDYNRGRDQYRAPQQPKVEDKEAQISQLASLLGVNTDALNAIRHLTGGQQQPQQQAPPPQNNGYQNNNGAWPKREASNGHYRERSPIRRQDSMSSGGYNQQPPQQPPQVKQQASNSKNWNPVTQDTIYLRNLPPTMTESRLRYLISQCGQISFIDFPMNRDNSPVGYAYIRFDGADALTAAKQAIAQYDNYPIEGQRLECGLY